MKDITPIAVFAFNRPKHLERLFASLDANPEAGDSPFYVFCDGPRDARDGPAVRETRDVVDRFARTHRASIFKQTVNRGLAQSITGGIETVLERHDRFVVLEDDLVVSRHFLRFMNRSLELFRDRRDVGCVSGYMYPVALAQPRAVLLPFVTSWGWATWADRWQAYNPNGDELAREIARTGRRKEFDLDGSFHYWGMLQDQIHGWSSSWWIRWYATLFLKNQMSVWPGISLILNEGMDGSGTHCGASALYEGILAEQEIAIDPMTDTSNGYLEAIKAFLAPRRHPDALLALRRHVPRSVFHGFLRPVSRRLMDWRR